jgi:hypothetical protein
MIENFRQRKKDISQKLEYMGKDKDEIREIIKLYYDFLGIITFQYKDFERLINSLYEKRIHAEKERDKEAAYFEKKKIEIVNAAHGFPDVIY